MAFHEIKTAENAPVQEKVLAWVDSRFPLSSTIKTHLTEYYAPKNLNFWYFFGAFSIVVLALLCFSCNEKKGIIKNQNKE